MKHLMLTLAVLGTVILFSCSKPDEPTNPVSHSDLRLEKGAAAGPTITSITPSSAEIGDVLTITGKNFGSNKGPNSDVTIMGINASVFQSWSKTQIIVPVPSGAVNGVGTVSVTINSKKSNEVTFTLLQSSPITIGGQTWMGSNLDVSKYNDGTDIPYIEDQLTWATLTTGAWCYYGNDPANGPIYGKLYNWYAVNDQVHGGIAPSGWHVPTEDEWKTLFINLGMSPEDADGWGYPPYAYYGTDEGGKLKEQGISLWQNPNNGATNVSGFTALPGGYRGTNGGFYGKATAATWWASTEFGADRGWMRMVVNYYANTYHNNLPKMMGLSVRCIQNN